MQKEREGTTKRTMEMRGTERRLSHPGYLGLRPALPASRLGLLREVVTDLGLR